MRPAPFRILVILPPLFALFFAVVALAQEASERPRKKKRATSETAESTPKPSKKAADEEEPVKPSSKKKPASTSDETPAATPKPRKNSAPATEEPAKKKEVDESNADADEADAASAKLRKKQPAPGETPPASTPAGKAGSAPNASVEPDQIVEYGGLSESVRKLIDASLALTKQNLTYTYGSADPANGGMDCSGTIYYLLRQAGFKDVPRDASGLYSWVRKEGKFFAVISKKADGFEFSDLKPGDLLFWNGTYSVDRDPPVTHVMIYLGTEKGRNKRIMVGASDGRTYDGKSRWGVSVFDFVMPRPRPGETMAKADFLGYARVPMQEDESEKAKAAESAPITAAEPKEEAKPVASSTSKRRSPRTKSNSGARSSD